MEYVFPLKQHVGVPAEVIVQENEVVQRGQMIAVKPKESLSANIFTSVSGTIKQVCPDRIIIEEADTDFAHFLPLKEEESKALIEEAGIVGLGGAGFPTSVKVNVDFGGTGTVIVNAAECEPILSHNIDRVLKEPEKLIRGLNIVMDIVNASQGIVAIKGIHEEAIRKIEQVIAQDNISVFSLDNIYPVGEERAIIRDVLDILLEPDKLPLAAQAVVLNAETILRIREAVDEKKPFIDKDITVAGKLKENASIHVLYDIPLGRQVAEILAEVGGLDEEYGELIMGGPFTGKKTTVEEAIVKTSGGIIATEKFLPSPAKIGLLVCACGADEERLKEQAKSMHTEVVGVEYCKQAIAVKNSRKCENPGRCPGQVQKVMALKKAGAQGVLISNCTDCSNTVMSCAPQLKLSVYHCTDGAMRAVNLKMIRKFKKEE